MDVNVHFVGSDVKSFTLADEQAEKLRRVWWAYISADQMGYSMGYTVSITDTHEVSINFNNVTMIEFGVPEDQVQRRTANAFRQVIG